MQLFLAIALTSATLPGAAGAACREQSSGEARYAVCEFDAKKDDIRLFLNDDGGAPHGDFSALQAALAAKGETLLFAMNAGMYHDDRSPVGLYVENGAETAPLSTTDGPGNFHLKPNGVFWIAADGAAHVTSTDEFAAPAATAASPAPACGRGARGEGPSASDVLVDRPSPPTPLPQMRERGGACVAYATQSGPMLVIDGKIHPRFLVDATSKKRRNGVGVDGDRVVFALSGTPVTFHEFATFFLDELKTPNALYLDGTISRLFAPELTRNDPGAAMGPIVGVVAAKPEEGNAQ